jgi:hypothetical protein
MEYEGSIGFVMRKMKKKYCWFSRFRTFYGQKHDLSDKKISVCHAPLPSPRRRRRRTRNLCHAYSLDHKT